MAKDVQIEKVALKFGIPTAIGFIAYFLIMRALGLASILELRALNFIILLAGVFLAIKYEKNKNPEFAYLKGLGTGIATAFVALLIFCIFLAIYLDALDPEFMSYIKQHEMYGEFLNPYIASAAILLEGALSGVLISFISMQYFKRSHLTSKETLR